MPCAARFVRYRQGVLKIGFTFEHEMDMGKQGPYCFIEHGGREIGAMMRRSESGASRWDFAFRTKGTIRAAFLYFNKTAEDAAKFYAESLGQANRNGLPLFLNLCGG